MPSFGQKLKAEREKRSITLEQISLSTKIGTRLLQALEEEKFNQLPGGIFNKGFVRAYARHIGIDEDQAVADYLEASGDDAQFRSPESGSAVEKSTVEENTHDELSLTSRFSRELPWGLFAAALLLVALALSVWNHRRHVTGLAESPQSAVPVAATSISHSPEPSNVASTVATSSEASDSGSREGVSHKSNAPKEKNQSSDASSPELTKSPQSIKAAAPELTTALRQAAPASSQAGEFIVSIQAREESWISIIADGKPEGSYVANAGAHRIVRARQLVSVKAGNVGGVDFLFNGKKIALQGEKGQVKTLVFGPEGLQATPAQSVSE